MRYQLRSCSASDLLMSPGFSESLRKLHEPCGATGLPDSPKRQRAGPADETEVLAKLAGQGEETAACWCYSINAVAISTQIGVVCVDCGHTPGRRVLRSGFLLGFAALGRSLGALRRLAPAPSQDLVRSKGQNPKHQVGHHLRPSANSHAGGSVFVLQPAKHSLYRRPL